MLNQLRIKFVAFVMIVATILASFLLTLLYHATAAAMKADHIELMQSVEGVSPPNGFSPEEDAPDDRLHYFMLVKTVQGEIQVADNTGFDLSNTGLLNELYDVAAQSEEEFGELDEYALRYTEANSPYFEGYVFSDISDEYVILRNLRNSCILIGFMSVFILGIFTNILSRIIIRPVEQAWEKQKQFVADASHELKTPLTVITTNVEMLASPDYNQSQKNELVSNIASMTQRMRSLVEGLLDLARLDSGAMKNAFSTVDYSALVEQSLLPFEPVFFETGRFLESEIAPNICLYGSASHLGQVTDILLDNALKYSYKNTTVRVILQRQGKYALLCVENDGDPITKADLKRIFQRFYTVDKARTGNSYGLGLSIADAIVREHKGKIWAESEKGKNKFFIRLPM